MRKKGPYLLKCRSFLFLTTTLIFLSCEQTGDNRDYKQEMRDFVIAVSEYSKSLQPDFSIIPQNGVELVSITGEEEGEPHSGYLGAIDGIGQEDLYFGYDRDDKSTPEKTTSYLKSFLEIAKKAGNTILVTDYCSTHSNMDDSYSSNGSDGFVSFAADHRELDNIPVYPLIINAENSKNISALSQVENFLYLINPEKYLTRSDFIGAIRSTNYDLVIMDLFFNDGNEFTIEEIELLRQKENGGTRLVVAYMSIGEAEEYRYYWKDAWNTTYPSWLDRENPDWEGNFKVKYWNEEWQNIIFGNEDSYLDRIVAAGFDGVYLDIIDAFEFFE